MQLIFQLCLLLTSALSLSVVAAEINCQQATSLAEINICKDATLLQLDQQVAADYAKLLHAPAVNKAHVQQLQKAWLTTRNQCADVDCLKLSHQNRIAELAGALHQANAYQPDATDNLALAQLKQAVKAELKSNQAFALENALKQFEIKTGITTFANVMAGGDGGDNQATVPEIRPKGVSVDEWRAFVQSDIDAGGENGQASYTLLDVNNDGKRDLILDSYIGGTGLFNYVSVLPRRADRFVGHYTCLQKSDCEQENADALYSLNGRGSNQAASWVKLQSRVYVAYRRGYYGVDYLTLLRPLNLNGEMPTLSLHYEYTLSVPKKQLVGGKAPYVLTAKEHAALSQALLRVNRRASDDTGQDLAKPLCPVPTSATEDERYGYSSFGPGHYSFEIVSNVAVWIDQTCYVAQLINWFGGYDEKEGLHAMLWMHRPNAADDATKEYQVIGWRKLVKISTGLASVVE